MLDLKIRCKERGEGYGALIYNDDENGGVILCGILQIYQVRRRQGRRGDLGSINKKSFGRRLGRRLIMQHTIVLSVMKRRFVERAPFVRHGGRLGLRA